MLRYIEKNSERQDLNMGVFETIVDQIRDAQMVTYDQLVYIFEHIDEEKE